MKKTIPDSRVVIGHRDHALLSAIGAEITLRAGGPDALAQCFGEMLRRCIDDVILTPKTGRRSYDALEKTEKTYIGTRVEIELRALLRLPKGRLDTVILGHDVDIKNTMGSNWMIPSEALGQPCILVAADEDRAVCFLGLIVARVDYLTASGNRDSKKSISSQGFKNIFWLLRGHPYPSNFWRSVSAKTVDRIFAEPSGNRRLAVLFQELQRQPISRDVIAAVAQQHDFMRRIRSDKGRGTRDRLAREGVLLLSGQCDGALIAALGLPACPADAFLSHRVTSQIEADLAERHGFKLTWQQLI